MDNLTLEDYIFDEPNQFGQKTDEFLLELAKERGFYNGYGPYNELFAKLFYSGGTLNFKDGVYGKEFKNNATRYLKSLMISFTPQHEDKEAVCALILSELVDI